LGPLQVHVVVSFVIIDNADTIVLVLLELHRELATLFLVDVVVAGCWLDAHLFHGEQHALLKAANRRGVCANSAVQKQHRSHSVQSVGAVFV
jgi:hypothetical protein